MSIDATQAGVLRNQECITVLCKMIIALADTPERKQAITPLANELFSIPTLASFMERQVH